MLQSLYRACKSSTMIEVIESVGHYRIINNAQIKLMYHKRKEITFFLKVVQQTNAGNRRQNIVNFTF